MQGALETQEREKLMFNCQRNDRSIARGRLFGSARRATSGWGLAAALSCWMCLVMVDTARGQCVDAVSAPDFIHGSGPEGRIDDAYTVDPDGAGPILESLFVRGDFVRADGVSGYAGLGVYNGQTWRPVPALASAGVLRYLYSGKTLFVSVPTGDLSSEGMDLGYLAEYLPRDNRWGRIVCDGEVSGIEPYGTGHFFRGSFTRIGNITTSTYAIRLGNSWAPLPRLNGEPAPNVTVLGPERFAAYTFNGSWSNSSVWLNTDGVWRSIVSPPDEYTGLIPYNGGLCAWLWWYSGNNTYTGYGSMYTGSGWTPSFELPQDRIVMGEYYIHKRREQDAAVRRLTASIYSPPLFYIFSDNSFWENLRFRMFRDRIVVLDFFGGINNTSVGSVGTIKPSDPSVIEGLGRGLLSEQPLVFPAASPNDPVVMLNTGMVGLHQAGRDQVQMYTGSEWIGTAPGRTPARVGGLQVFGHANGTNYYGFFGDTQEGNALIRVDPPSQAGGMQRTVSFIFPTNVYATRVFEHGDETFVATANLHSSAQSLWRLAQRGARGAPDIWEPAPFGEFIPDISWNINGSDHLLSINSETAGTVVRRWTGVRWEAFTTLPAIVHGDFVTFKGLLYVIGHDLSGGTNTTPFVLYRVFPDGSYSAFPSAAVAPTSEGQGPASFVATERALYVVSTYHPSAGNRRPLLLMFYADRWSVRTDVDLTGLSGGFSARPYREGLLVSTGQLRLPSGEPTYKFAYVPDPLLCLGDLNCDGGIDGSDVTYFFDRFAVSAPLADLNQDGGVDGADVIEFYEAWSNGTPACR